jgi:hypothetical protein
MGCYTAAMLSGVYMISCVFYSFYHVLIIGMTNSLFAFARVYTVSKPLFQA